MKYINYILIIIGLFVTMYAKSGTDKNQYILIGGIVILMIGVYRLSKTIPSRTEGEKENNSENDSHEF